CTTSRFPRVEPPLRNLLTVLLIFALASPLLGGEILHAGAAKIEIPPPVGMPLWGYANRHDAPSTGVLDPLFARALVLSVGKERLALVSLDLGRPPTRTIVASIRKRVQKDAGIQQLFLVASHTHHG